MLELRHYQLDLLERTRAEMRRGVRRVCLQSSTGSGKTILTAQMLAAAAARGKRSWFVVHRTELLRQSVETFVTAADLHVGIIAAGFPSDASAPVQVCSVGTLARRLGKINKPDLLVWDECHHLPSKSWASIAQAVPDAVQIGLTATPARLDGHGLRPFFDALVLGPSTADLIAAGWLSHYRLFAPSTVSMTGVHTVAGDYNKREAADVLGKSSVTGDAVSTYLRHCPTGRALVFAWSLEASRALQDAFLARGVPAVHVDGDSPADARQRAVAGLRDGSVRVLTNCELFGEGLDVPAVDAVFLLRPTQSLGLYLQQCGRGLRMSPGKSSVTIFDHAGNYTRHGLPDDPRAWTLDGIDRDSAPREAAVKRCPKCFGVAGAACKVCPFCHAVYPVKQRKVARIDGELVEADIAALRGQVRELQRECRTLPEWQALAKRLQYKAGWAWMQFQRSIAHRNTGIWNRAKEG